MDKKIKTGYSSYGIVGIILGFLGSLYFFIGLMLTFFPEDHEDSEVGIVFAVLGGFILLTAVSLGIYALLRRNHLKKVVAEGKYLWGQITDIIPTFGAKQNGRASYTIMVRYIDRNGVIHIFRSALQNKYPDRSIMDKQVKVYYENESYKLYYVDLDGVLPNVIEH